MVAGTVDRNTKVVHVNGEAWGSMQFYLDAQRFGFQVRNRHVVEEGGMHYLRADVTCNGRAWWVGVDCGASLHAFFREGIAGSIACLPPVYLAGQVDLSLLHQHSAGT